MILPDVFWSLTCFIQWTRCKMQHCGSHMKELDFTHNHFAANVQQTNARCCCALWLWQTWLHNVLTKFDQGRKKIGLRGGGGGDGTEAHFPTPTPLRAPMPDTPCRAIFRSNSAEIFEELEGNFAVNLLLKGIIEI